MAKYCILRDGPALYPDCKECSDKLCEHFFCLVVGSRTFNNYLFMKEKLDNILIRKEKVVIVSGGAKGADSLAERYAKEKGYPLMVFKADWSKGKSAGYIRNEEMHRFIAKTAERGCVAFWDGISKGTTHNFKLAEQYGTNLRIIIFQ